ncbi:5-deoxy-glucuronate isomerase [Streptomyces sp. NPDC002467]|uniref:5-deoxy-glucuronate isomerase n=2 Tax=unclassified Streptomyces TaxID=2593676 RepID=UPI003673C6DA
MVLPLSGACEVRCAEPPGAAPHPAPQTPAGLKDRGSAPDPGPQPPDGLELPPAGPESAGPGENPASPAFEARGSGGGAHSFGKGRGGGGSAGPDDVRTTFQLRGRSGVFGGVSDFVYVPRDSSVQIRAAEGGRFALAGARCEVRLEARYGPAADVPVELRGAGQCSRQVHNFGAAGVFPADRLIAVEVLTPGGNWSSYPPHKHDTHLPGEESRLEEIYYFEIAPHGHTPGFGYQRVTPSPAGKTDILAEVRSGDAVLIPDGWHGPSIAAPGHDMYYLNVMAGPPGEPREWLIRDHPEHAWIRGSWDGREVDPRLPFHRAEDEAR